MSDRLDEALDALERAAKLSENDPRRLIVQSQANAAMVDELNELRRDFAAFTAGLDARLETPAIAQNGGQEARTGGGQGGR